MTSDHGLFPSTGHEYLLHNARLHFFLLCFLFISSFAIRLYHITEPPLDFAPIRQYQNATNARAAYYNVTEGIPEDQKKIANINADRMGFTLEPRIVEYLAVTGYRIAGSEKLWIPRVLSSFFWITGGIFLFLIAQKLTSSAPALFSTIFYLFLPYSISASRSFQPDPLMVMLLLIALYFILVNHEQQTTYYLILSAVIASLALFIKPYCVFLIFGVYAFLIMKKYGIKKALCKYESYVFTLISMLPAFLYYGYNTFMKGGDAQSHAQLSFLPYLLIRPYFWMDWLTMIGRVTGLAALIGAVIGLFISQGLLRTVLAGLWVGYVIFGMIFTFHIHTHDYYQLQFIPVVALSLIPVAAAVAEKLRSMDVSRKKLLVLSTTVLLILAVAGLVGFRENLKDYKHYIKPAGMIIGINPDFYHFLTADYEPEVRAARVIGDIVEHSTTTVFLTKDYGRSLSYHGVISGLPWPTRISLRGRVEIKAPISPKEDIFNPRYLLIRTYRSQLFDRNAMNGGYIRYTPDYFIITDFEEFNRQPDLKKYLYDNFPVKAKSDQYLIFDMSRMSMNDS